MDASTAASPEALAAFKNKHRQIVQTVTDRILAEPGAYAAFGDRAEKTILAGIDFVTLNLEAVMLLGEPTLLDQQILWAQDRLPHDGVSPQSMMKHLEIYAVVVTELLPAPLAQEVNRFVQHLIDKQRSLL